jgi:hypothetical protein
VRVLTVRQPWAWAIVHGGKDVENRTRNLAGAYRGPVAIHAGLTDAIRDNDIDASALSVLWAWRRWWKTAEAPGAQRGHIIGVVDLVGAHPSHVDGTRCGGIDAYGLGQFCSAWAQAGHHHLVLANPRPLAGPIPAAGRLGLWRPGDELAAAIAEQLR